MAVITLLTDFGLLDGYPGVMKGVILSIAPGAQIVDLSHDISPQNVMEGALLLSRSARFFPEGTIHVAVVDPGVGTTRRAITGQIGSQYFVGPDNGIFSLVILQAEADQQPIWIGELDQPAFWLSTVSKTFHGRDIFAPVAGHLATGVDVRKISTKIDNPVRLELPKAVRTTFGWSGQLLHIDHFGNTSTNISASMLANSSRVSVEINGIIIVGLVTNFAEQAPGNLVNFIDSNGFLAIAAVNGNAAKLLLASAGDPVSVHLNA
jgi:S-adenosylmethionine hydrolase